VVAYQGGVHSVGVGIVIILLCVTNITSNISKQCNLDRLKSRLKKGHQRDANLCGACACPTDEHSLVRGGGGYNQGSFVYFAKTCGGWVFAGVNGVG